MPESASQAESTARSQPATTALDEPPGETRTAKPSRWRTALTGPSVIAILTWVVATPLLLLVERSNDSDPFSVRGAFVPFAAGGALFAVVTAAACLKRAGERIAAVGAGLFAAWVAFALQVALNGTPFGFSGLVGDMGRMAAAANRYSVNPKPSDAFIETITSEYPPLYPWLVGRASNLLDIPAWQLLSAAEVLVTSFAVLAAFLMWRRLVPTAAALAVSGVGLLVFGDPRKAFSVITLFVFVPWLIAAFTNPARGKLHWLPAGLLGGLIMLTYNGWFPFGVLGILAILVSAWRRSDNRKAYALHVVGVGVVALIVATPYLAPYALAVLTQGGQGLGDLYMSYEIPENGFPFLQPTLLGALELTGLAGLIWYRTRTSWAWPMLYLVLGSSLFWVLMGIRFVLTQHTTLIHYIPRLTGITLAAAGVLTLAQAAPALLRRVNLTAPPRVGVAATAVAVLWAGVTYWDEWRPLPTLGTSESAADRADYSTMAHLEPLPDCSYPQFAPQAGRQGCLPAEEIKDRVQRVRGTEDRPVTLSTDERLFAFLPWRGYMGTDRTSASSLSYWDDRHEEIVRLSNTKDPQELARASGNTKFGPIDVFVLHRRDDQTWIALDRAFTPAQFASPEWVVSDDLSRPYVVVTRKP
ncbi:arabinofuranosyltransferase [Actinokineospora iranica]|uniref:arabinofuranosyltransferase n=1 Tax=Actinokineospora iranica TaxID=1271860 RepID=UPI001587D125|nr:arabinofuranosyltransferase [Actinokineospora iranica]